MSLLLPTRWQKQPQGPVEIDWSHPLARGLTGLWIFNTAYPVNLVTGEKSSIFLGSPTRNLNENGIGFQYNSLQLASNAQSLITDSAASLYFESFGTDTPTSVFLGSRDNFTSPTDYFEFNTISGVNGNNLAGFFGSSSFVVNTSISGSGKNKVLLSATPSAKRVYSNGILNASNLTSGDTCLLGTSPFYVGVGNPASTSFPEVSFQVVATWKRALSAKEAYQIRQNTIYQLLKPVTQIRVSDLSVLNINLAASLDSTSPVISADFTQIAEGETVIDASLPVSIPNITANIDTGNAITDSFDAPAPQLDGFFGQFTAVNASLRLSAPSLQASFIGGTVIGASLSGPSASITGEIVHGVAAQADLSAPAPTLQASIAPQVELPAPAARLNASFVVGIVANGTLTSPEPRLNAALSDDRTLRAELPSQAPSITGSFVFNQVFNADLPAPAARIRANMHMGIAIQAVLTSPAPKLDAEFGANAIISASLPGPAPRLQANFTMPKPAATFYNRWTR